MLLRHFTSARIFPLSNSFFSIIIQSEELEKKETSDMKRFFCVVIAVLLAAVCFAASAEEEQSPGMTCSVEDGRLVIRVPRKADDAGSWEAEESEEDDSVITLSSSDITDSLATFVYGPV